MSRSAKPDAVRAAFDVWVAVAIERAASEAHARADLGRKARFVRGLVPRLTQKPGLPSLKGLNADDLRGWADRLERESRA